jgi:ferric-dicitrate binding protein FerR (iron transport regulator)
MELHEQGRSESHNSSKEGDPKRALSIGEPTTIGNRETAEQYRHAAALRMGSLATAAHHAAGDLEAHFPQAARYTEAAAAGLTHISNFLYDPNLDEVATLLRNLGRRQPAAVAAGVVVVGLALSWLVKIAMEGGDTTAADAMVRGGEGGAGGIH